MTTAEIIPTKTNPLAQAQPGDLSQNPITAYLAGMATERTRAVQQQALNEITDILAPGRFTAPPRLPGQDKAAYKLARADYDARCFAIPWPSLRYSHAQAIRTVLAERYAAATANRLLSALRGVLKASFLLGLVGAEEYQRAVMVKAVTGESLPAGRELTPGEISALMADCENDPSPAGVRDAAIIALLYSCGLRRAELVGLLLADYDPETGALVVRGKRNKERKAFVINGAARALADWLAVRGAQAGPLFCAINKGGRIIPGQLTAQALYNLLAKRGESAGLKNFSPHDIRRTFASDLLENGADIATVAKMMGHASVNTTARYDRRPDAEKRKAAGLLHVPYHGKILK